jgi:multisubunit Na+/H+ antiporter MnhB subunit
MLDIILYLLVVLVIVSALAALYMDDLISSVISLGAAGLCLCAVFLLLGAFDLAVVQLVFEMLVLIIIIRATEHLDLTPKTSGRREYLVLASFIFFSAAFLAAMIQALREFPKFGEPLMKISKTILENSPAQTGASSVISAILFDYRAMDSLGVLAVLFCSLLGALSILRETGSVIKK